MNTGRIVKALSGFYYVDCGDSEPLTCRGRGKLRHQQMAPLVGDEVRVEQADSGEGVIDEVLPRRNAFRRPAVANVDQLVMIVCDTIPVTDPFLIDRLTSMAARQDCQCVICINKCDLVRSDRLYSIYTEAGYPTLHVSAVTGEGIDQLTELLKDQVSVFTGNSGAGKSSILNKMEPDFSIPVAEVSQKLGRGRHTTRHVELFRLRTGGFVADTPGFSSFENETPCPREELAATFPEFRPFLDKCRFAGCTHRKEKGCAVLAAVDRGEIPASRHKSYVRLYQEAEEYKPWEHKK
ncbi:MAG: ribosome small subunit-dependent GTPase A [Oscillospiraceae bacterium]|nr:ribosome small subunit-dependent GTPase A [Oscillospiraceae bacterium]